MNRVKKAIKYLNKHRGKKEILDNKETICMTLVRVSNPSSSSTIQGCVGYYLKVIDDRFSDGFKHGELIYILTQLNTKYTKKQEKFFNE